MQKYGGNYSILIFFLIYSVVGFAQSEDMASNERTTPSGFYMDPGSKFFLHGYITGSFGKGSENFGESEMTSEQIIVNGYNPETKSNPGGFQTDLALFIGSEPYLGFQGIVEIHFVRTALNPVITEAKILWNILKPESHGFSLTFGLGRQWWPFGNHNRQWFSALNTFNLISPLAKNVLPAHLNELGAWVEGYYGKNDFGINGVVSVGNGPISFSMMKNVMANPFGMDKKPTVTGRLGIIPGITWAEIGLSGSWGGMREQGIIPAVNGSDPNEFGADFFALGSDLQIDLPFGLKINGDFAWSREVLDGAGKPHLDRVGFDIESSYTLPISQQPMWLWSISPKLRYAEAFLQKLTADTFHYRTIGGGINYQPVQQAMIKAEYELFLPVGGNLNSSSFFNTSLSINW